MLLGCISVVGVFGVGVFLILAKSVDLAVGFPGDGEGKNGVKLLIH